MNSSKILFRSSLSEFTELDAAQIYFDVIESRSLVQQGDIVIGRYSVLPFYEETEKDIQQLGGQLVNSYTQHKFVADIENWYKVFQDITPKTWFSLEEVLSDDYQGPYVLKGRTNSRKHLWRTHMYAANKDEVREVYGRLLDDSLIGHQGIIIRQFEQFVNYGLDLAGMPITREFRFFSLGNTIVDGGFYWASHPEVIEEHKPSITGEASDFSKEVRNRCRGMINFVSFDIAETVDGQWRLVELNDGQMSGLSCIDPIGFYSRLAKVVRTMGH